MACGTATVHELQFSTVLQFTVNTVGSIQSEHEGSLEI